MGASHGGLANPGCGLAQHQHTVPGDFRPGHATALCHRCELGRPSFNGRDATLSGDAPSQQAIDTALEALAGVYGVRTVFSNARVVAPPPVTLIPPRIKPLISKSAMPQITGTWQEGAAKTLAVTLAAKVYKFGTDQELTSNAGHWTLKPSTPLADGTYDMTAEVSDGINPAIATITPEKLVIDTVAPPPPVITPLASGIHWPFTLNGTWIEDGATSLSANLANQTWTLGKDADLRSDGKGNWSFAPVVDLRPGTYEITVEVQRSGGKHFKIRSCSSNCHPGAAGYAGNSYPGSP